MSAYCDDEIVISGIAGRFPESDDISRLKENLMNKVDLVSDDCRRWKLGNFDQTRLIAIVTIIFHD